MELPSTGDFFPSGSVASMAKRKAALTSFYKSVVGTFFPPLKAPTSEEGMSVFFSTDEPEKGQSCKTWLNEILF